MEQLSQNKMFDGDQLRYEHQSQTCNCPMRFAIYLPPQAAQQKVPVLYWLSGLTCNEENFILKAGAQRVAAELGIALVAPDTSPRNLGFEGEDDTYDFGSGAGFYVNATEAPWSTHYQMFDYVNKELPALITEHFPILADKQSIFGHSMGGHGAMISALKNPGQYQSISAFAPICAPTQSNLGEKAFTGYLGGDRETWNTWDSVWLIANTDYEIPILIDQGDADEFLQDGLKPSLLQEAAAKRNYPLNLRMRPGYDHGYYFIASFVEEHMRYHAEILAA
ncbi:MAG: S-formylglutathione hydrolase [Pseudomonadota bacterium]